FFYRHERTTSKTYTFVVEAGIKRVNIYSIFVGDVIDEQFDLISVFLLSTDRNQDRSPFETFLVRIIERRIRYFYPDTMTQESVHSPRHIISEGFKHVSVVGLIANTLTSRCLYF